MYKKLIIFLLTILLGCAYADSMTLVKNCKGLAVIVLPAKAAKSAQLGALELQYHIKKMTGAELPIVNAPVNGKIALKIGFDNENMTVDSHKIIFGKNDILLSGSDSPDYGKVDYNDVNTFPRYDFTANGSLFAVYDFLEDYCGVRFFSMYDKDTIIPEKATLTVEKKNREFSSQMDAFRFVYDDDSKTFSKNLSDRDRRLWQLRWRMCDYYGRVNHTQYSIYFKHWAKAKMPKLAKMFKEKREDLFAKGFKGKNHSVDYILQVNYPNDPDIPPQLCYSNQDTVKYYADEVLTYASGKNVVGGWRNFWGDYPENTTRLPRFKNKPFFYPIQGGDTGGHCLCADCKKRFPNDNADDVSNNKFQFIADAAREAAKKNPEAGVATLAYIHTLNYPEKVNFPANVTVQLCLPIYSWWHPVALEKQKNEYKKWVSKEAKKRPLTLWTYIFSPHWDSEYHFGKYTVFPGAYPWKTGEIFKGFIRDGIRGWFTEVEMKYNPLEAYVAAKLCYNGNLSYENIIEDYFKNAYGNAAAEISEFYRELEKAYWNSANCPASWLKDRTKIYGPKGVKHDNWTTGLWSPELNWQTATPERMKKLNSLIAAAEKKVAPNNPYFKRLKSLWLETLQGQKEFERYMKRKNAPRRTLAVNSVAEANGNFRKVSWSRAFTTEKWGNLNGEDVPNRNSVKAVADSKYIYFEFTDLDGADPKTHGQDDFEIFFSTQNKFPMYQICVSPKGDIYQYKYIQKDDKTEKQPYSFNLKSEQKLANGKWTVRLAVDKSTLPIKNGIINANFFRTNKKPYKAWNPIFTGRYLQGVDGCGELLLFPRVIQDSEFYRYKNGELSGKGTDNKADNGSYVWGDGTTGWTLQYLAKSFPKMKYRIKLRYRVELTSNVKSDFTCGIFDSKSKKNIAFWHLSANQPEFREVSLGIHEFASSMRFYLGKFSNPAAKGKIIIDSITFTPEAQK